MSGNINWHDSDMESRPTIFLNIYDIQRAIKSCSLGTTISKFEKMCGLKYVTLEGRYPMFKYRVIDIRKFHLARLKHGL